MAVLINGCTTLLLIACWLVISAEATQLDLARRAPLAPVRGPAVLIPTTTSTVPLAAVRGLATTTSTSKASSTTKNTTTASSTKSSSTSAKTTSAKPTTTLKSTRATVKPTTTTTTTMPSTTKASTTSTKVTSKTTSTKSTASSTSSAMPVSDKKGLSYNDAHYTALFGKSASWAYNWYSAPNSGLSSSVDFAPMLWSNATDLTAIWANNVKSAKARGETHLLGFNEPDLGEQANMTVAQSVEAWKKYMEPYKKDFKLVSPAVTNGGSPMGVAYLQSFLANCTGCQIDAVALHWYDAAWNTGYFFNYMNDAIKAFSPRPIWLTEFRGSGTAAEQVKFINTVVPWLEQQPQIEKYALFGLFEGSAADGNMITNGTLNEVGLAYARAS